MNPLIRCIALLAMVLATSAHAGIAFHVDVDTHVEPGAGTSGPPPADTHRALDVAATDQAMVVSSATETTVYDFRNRRRSVVDRKTGTRVDYSLYDLVGQRVMELQNRTVQGKALASVKIESNPFTSINNEHDLGIQDHPSSPLRMDEDAAGLTFSDGPRVFYRQGREVVVLKPDDARLYARFLRHAGSMHPQIVTAIEKTGRIATDFVVTHDMPVVQITTHHVRDMHTVDDASFDIAAYPLRPVAESGDPINRTLDGAALLSAADMQRAKEVNRAASVAASRDGRALDMLLGVAEYNLMTGEGITGFTPEQLQLIGADPITSRVRLALTAATREQFEAAVKIFLEARLSTKTNAHVLKIFEANDRARLGDRQAALALFTEVFAVNPMITSAYKDFGDLLLIGYDMPRAWRSWDAGRHIATGIPNFKPVDQFEASLAKQHPEFF